MKSNYQKLKSNLWIWILICTGVGILVMVLVDILLMSRLIETPNMIQHIYGLNDSNYNIIKSFFLFSIFFSIFYLLFFLLSTNFIKELNLQARSLLSLDIYVQFKEDYRFGLMGDDKKYITENADQMDSYHYLRRITLRKPLHWGENLFIFLVLLWGLYFSSVIYPNSLQEFFLFVVLLYLQMDLSLFVYLFRKIKSLLLSSQKVDELLEAEELRNKAI